MAENILTVMQPDGIEADRWSALGNHPVWTGSSLARPPSGIQAVLIGVDADATLQCHDTDAFDVLLTTAVEAPAPWISVPASKMPVYLDHLTTAVEAHRVAASILVRTLRLTEILPFAQALDVESLAYSTLLGGDEFRRWHKTQHHQPDQHLSTNDPVVVARDADHVTITLNDIVRSNAMSAQMRDALYAALVNVIDDPTCPTVLLQGSGRCFSTGGHLPEFGTANDLAAAHVVRTLHNCARALYQLGERAAVHLHGACIGSGIEVPAAANRRLATPDSWFQLPELRMGLIPGAGGTVSVARAIGRHRTAWMVLSGSRISAPQALAMGLIHAVRPR